MRLAADCGLWRLAASCGLQRATGGELAHQLSALRSALRSRLPYFPARMRRIPCMEDTSSSTAISSSHW